MLSPGGREGLHWCFLWQAEVNLALGKVLEGEGAEEVKTGVSAQYP